jgi:melibiose permease/lactose/raffinose/galactose permease
MLVFQSITLIGVRETEESRNRKEESTSLKEMVKVIFFNDQLLVASIAMALFQIGYMTTTGFGLYYFKYVYGDEGMYSIFAVILGVSQIVALSVFPMIAKKYPRKQLYTFSTILVVVGYIIFFFAPTNTMAFIGIAGVLLFVGQAFIQIMMLMFLTDTVEYGEWKFKKRNDSVTLALQPFVNKFGGAVASGITGAIVIISGMKEAQTAADMTAEGLLILKAAMMILPLVCIVVGFLIYRKKYILDEEMYAKIVKENEARRAE